MKKPLVILFLIVLLGSFLRLSFGQLFPPSMNWDEVSLGYNAYSLLLTGADEWGQPLPAIFRAYGDYKLPVYVYSAIPFIKVFGLNTFSTRLPSLLSGILLIVLTYLLTYKLFHQPRISLVAAFLVATQPWDLFLSRVAVEANLCLMLITLGLTLLVYKKYFWALIFLGLSVWTYNSARIFTPLFIGSYLLNHRPRFNFLNWLLLIIFIVPMVFQLLNPVGTARFNWVNILDSGAIARIISSRQNSTLPNSLARLIHNRPVYFLTSFTKNYLSYFSPRFLFINGGSQYQFNIPQIGLLALVNLPLFYLGLILLISKKTPNRWLILSWLFLAPLAGSVTRDSPHTLRALIMYPAVILTIITGLSWFLSRFKSFIVLYLLIIIISLAQYLLVSTPNYLTTFAWSWQYGYSQVMDYVKANYQKYDQIIITKKYGEPHEFVLFYWPWSPKSYQTDSNLNRYFRSDWYWVDSFAKFNFVNDWEMKDYVDQLSPEKNYLIISSPDNLPAARTLKQINFPTNLPAFIIQSL